MSFAENLKDLLDSKEIEVKELAHGTGISKNTLVIIYLAKNLFQTLKMQ